MDSLTQMALGAAVGGAVGARRYGRKAALLGAVVGTLPDLDVFVPLGDPVSDFTYHRSVSHAILVCILATPAIAFIVSKIKWFAARFDDLRLHATILLILLTHIFLDALTVYGTQIFWPLRLDPVGAGSVFIIDPLYTLTILAGLSVFLATGRRRPNKIALLLSTLYLLWGLGAHYHVTQIARASDVGPRDRMLVQATPFNTLLWRVLIMENDGYRVGYRSVFDGDAPIRYTFHPSTNSLIAPIADTVAVERLAWFSKGFFAVRETTSGQVVIDDLRMGLEPDSYSFSFAVGEIRNGTTVEIPNQRMSSQRDISKLPTLWARIWDPDIDF